jgi:hypothetical protein
MRRTRGGGIIKSFTSKLEERFNCKRNNFPYCSCPPYFLEREFKECIKKCLELKKSKPDPTSYSGCVDCLSLHLEFLLDLCVDKPSLGMFGKRDSKYQRRFCVLDTHFNKEYLKNQLKEFYDHIGELVKTPNLPLETILLSFIPLDFSVKILLSFFINNKIYDDVNLKSELDITKEKFTLKRHGGTRKRTRRRILK